MAKNSKTKRFNLILPEELVERVQEIAEEEHLSAVEVMRRFIKLGLLATDIQRKPDSALILREGDDEKQIMFL